MRNEKKNPAQQLFSIISAFMSAIIRGPYVLVHAGQNSALKREPRLMKNAVK